MIVYGVILLALFAVLGGLYGKGRSDGHTASDAQWKPKLEAMTTERDTAVRANENLQRDVAGVRKEAAACTKETERLQSVGTEARGLVQKAIADSAARQKAIEGRLAQYDAGARAAATGTKEQQCDAAKATLLETSARFRLILGLPPGDTAPAPVPQPAEAPASAKPVVVVPPSKPSGAVKLPPGVKP